MQRSIVNALESSMHGPVYTLLTSHACLTELSHGHYSAQCCRHVHMIMIDHIMPFSLSLGIAIATFLGVPQTLT